MSSTGSTGKKRVSVVAEETDDQLQADEIGGVQGTKQRRAHSPHSTPAKFEGVETSPKSMPVSLSDASLASEASRYSPSSSRTEVASSQQPEPRSRTIFLQLGRDMKKATLDPLDPTTIASLRMLFTDKFAYNPGMSDFPAIYIRDPHSGIQYELEDMEEIKDRSVLCLNIERRFFSASMRTGKFWSKADADRCEQLWIRSSSTLTKVWPLWLAN